jgi:YjbE family integral membrane protein
MFAVLGAARFWVNLLQIIGINILLSGDNAMVIALASRSLPERQRRIAVVGGSAAAVVLRIVFCLVITTLLRIPYLKAVGGLLLLYIGVKLVMPEGDAAGEGLAATANVWDAIQTILVADAVMSLDNVVAIAAAAHGSVLLIALGLALSIPLIVFGSQVLLRILGRFPILVILGGALIGWIAGDILVSDPAVATRLPFDEQLQASIAKPLLAVFVVAVGMALSRWGKGRGPALVDLGPEGP